MARCYAPPPPVLVFKFHGFFGFKRSKFKRNGANINATREGQIPKRF